MSVIKELTERFEEVIELGYNRAEEILTKEFSLTSDEFAEFYCDYCKSLTSDNHQLQ